MDLKALVKKRVSKKIKFLGTDVEIYKLTTGQVMKIQELAKSNEKKPDGEGQEAQQEQSGSGIEVLKYIIANGLEGGDTLDDSDFEDFPMDDLNKVANEIMVFSGIVDKDSVGKSK
jgi:hypothetical protein